MVGRIKNVGRLVLNSPRPFATYWILVILCYLGFLLFTVYLSTSSWPNYLRVHGAIEGIVDALTMPNTPLIEKAYMVAYQPIVTVGVFVPRYAVASWTLPVTVLFVLSVSLTSGLLSIYLFLLGAYFRMRRVSRSVKGDAAGYSGAVGVSVAVALGSSISLGGCCGAAAFPVFLSLLGAGSGLAFFVAENSSLIGLIGLGILILSVLWLSGRIQVPEAICPADR